VGSGRPPTPPPPPPPLPTIGTATGSSPFIRAKIGIIANDGSGKAIRSPGSATARMAESSTSSEPHPVTTISGATPR
jgi:hypothetical protein